MISELTLARGYSSFWKELLPGGEYYIKNINAGLKERVHPPIDKDDIPNRRALVNNIAYSLFNKIRNGEISNSQFGINEKYKMLDKIAAVEREKLLHLKFLQINDALNQNEISIIIQMVNAMENRFRKYPNLIIAPQFKGCGLLFEATGDLYYHETLVELKAGVRNFSILDIRQLIIYGALNSLATEGYNIKKYHIYNPRLGLEWIENVHEVSRNLAGCSIGEIYSEVINFISNNYQSI